MSSGQMLLDSGFIATESAEPCGSGDDDITHAVCCEPDEAVCGYDVRDAIWAEDGDDELLCLDCELIIEGLCLWSCPYCGKEWTEE